MQPTSTPSAYCTLFDVIRRSDKCWLVSSLLYTSFYLIFARQCETFRSAARFGHVWARLEHSTVSLLCHLRAWGCPSEHHAPKTWASYLASNDDAIRLYHPDLRLIAKLIWALDRF